MNCICIGMDKQLHQSTTTQEYYAKSKNRLNLLSDGSRASRVSREKSTGSYDHKKSQTMSLFSTVEKIRLPLCQE